MGLLLSDTVLLGPLLDDTMLLGPLLDDTMRLRDGLDPWAYELDAARDPYDHEAGDSTE